MRTDVKDVVARVTPSPPHAGLSTTFDFPRGSGTGAVNPTTTRGLHGLKEWDVDIFLIWLEFAVLLGCIFIGSRYGGVGLGLWGSFGVVVLTYVFGLTPTSPPIDVMLIILAVIMAASVMEAAGGIDYLVSVAASVIQRNPQQITLVAPLVSYAFTFGAGTGHIFYPLLPIIYETAHDNDIRPERPIAVSTIASQQAITASPVPAAMAAMIALPGNMTSPRQLP